MCVQPSLLIAGGTADPNLVCLVDACNRLGIPVVDARHASSAADRHPSWTWAADDAPPRVDGQPVAVAGAFLRFDVFHDASPAAAHRAMAWYEAVMGWLSLEHRVRIVNRSMIQHAGWKPAMLKMARRAGLRVPAASITNAPGNALKEAAHSFIAKPVAGGGLCRSLGDAMAGAEWRDGLGASPAIIQRRLIPPEVRVFVIGRDVHAFEVSSPSLDYRESQDASLRVVGPELDVVPPLLRLFELAGMDFGAADFKTNESTGMLEFLELNTSPMFARFNATCNGGIAESLVRHLIGVGTPMQGQRAAHVPHASAGGTPQPVPLRACQAPMRSTVAADSGACTT